MLIILVLLFTGIAIGYLCRRITWLQHVEKTATATVYIMLFVFGLFIGTNDDIMSGFSHFGYQAVLIATATTLGSILITLLVIRIISRKGGSHER